VIGAAAIRADLGRYATANACARAQLSRLLGREGLEALYSYPSAAAMLEMLARTPYGPVLLLFPRTAYGLPGRLIEIGVRVLSCLSGPEAAFIRLFLLRHELENVKLIIRAVYRRHAWEQLAPHLCPLSSVGTIEPRARATLADLPALAERLAATPYGVVMSAALHRVDAAGTFALESALELDYYERLWTACGRLRRTDRVCARRLLGGLFDLLNLAWIARYRDALALSREEVLDYTLRQGRWVRADVRQALAGSPAGDWTALARTPYARWFAVSEPPALDLALVHLWRALAVEVDRALRVYPFHIGVPLGFLLAQDIEIRDLRVLLAAKSIGVPTAEAFDHVATVRH